MPDKFIHDQMVDELDHIGTSPFSGGTNDAIESTELTQGEEVVHVDQAAPEGPPSAIETGIEEARLDPLAAPEQALEGIVQDEYDAMQMMDTSMMPMPGMGSMYDPGLMVALGTMGPGPMIGPDAVPYPGG